MKRAEESGKDLIDAYYLKAGTPPVPVDSHPNALAHAIIAEEIAKTVRHAGTSRVSRNGKR